MKIFNWNDLEILPISQELAAKGTGISIGCFDGIHLGHQKLLGTLVDYCKKNDLFSIVITFSKPLGNISKKNDYLGDILDFNQRMKIIENTGVDYCLVINLDDFVNKIQCLSGIEFIEKIKSVFNIKMIVEGLNFRCGYKGATDINQIRDYCKHQNINCEFVEPVIYNGVKISSSEIRKALKNNNLELVNAMLGYDYNSLNLD